LSIENLDAALAFVSIPFRIQEKRNAFTGWTLIDKQFTDAPCCQDASHRVVACAGQLVDEINLTIGIFSQNRLDEDLAGRGGLGGEAILVDSEKADEDG
jgi:hypothetical protein